MPTYAYINTATQLVVSTLKYAKINKILMAENIADQFDKHEITS